MKEKVHSGRGHCTCSGRHRVSYDCTRTLPCDSTRELVFVLTDDIRVRQFPICGPARTTHNFYVQLHSIRCFALREFLFFSSLNFACHLSVSIAMHQAFSAKASMQRRCRVE